MRDQATSLRSPATITGLGSLGDLAAEQHQLGVARQRAVGLGRARRLGMDADQHDLLARAQAHAASAPRGCRRLQQEADLGLRPAPAARTGRGRRCCRAGAAAGGRGRAAAAASRSTHQASVSSARTRSGSAAARLAASPSTSRLVISTLTTTSRRLRAGLPLAGQALAAPQAACRAGSSPAARPGPPPGPRAAPASQPPRPRASGQQAERRRRRPATMICWRGKSQARTHQARARGQRQQGDQDAQPRQQPADDAGDGRRRSVQGVPPHRPAAMAPRHSTSRPRRR